MRGALAALLVAAAAAVAPPVSAATRQASVGNYWFEEDTQQDRKKITVRAGDQITFTIREGIYPPHTVDVDELDIHSPELLLGQTFTTPPLRRAGNFRLYCRTHEDRGHFTRLIVQAAPSPAKTPVASRAPARRPAAPAAQVRATPRATPKPKTTPRATLTPVGVGVAKPEALRRPVRQDPDSLDALIGREANTQPWTRAVLWLVLASVPIVGVSVWALWRNARRTR